MVGLTFGRTLLILLFEESTEQCLAGSEFLLQNFVRQPRNAGAATELLVAIWLRSSVE